MEATQPEQAHLEDIRQQLKEGGVPTESTDKQLCYIWSLFLRCQAKLRSATCELEQLREHQAEEMREVESYVGHVRQLTEARDALAAEFEKENEQKMREFSQLQLEHEFQQKEAKEMLEQEGLVDITHSSSSEQIAYLLVERSTLLEKLEALEQKVESYGCLSSLCASQFQFHTEERASEGALRERTEQDLGEAVCRVLAAPSEIQKRDEELDSQKKEETKLEASDLQKVRKCNNGLGKEILALCSREKSVDLERKTFVDQEKPNDHQEKVEILKSKLSEETEWRMQLIHDLEITQKALKDEKKELQNSKSELLRLCHQLQMLQKAVDERDFLSVAHEKLQQENLLLEKKVSELSQECEQLNQLAMKQKNTGERCWTTGNTCAALMVQERILDIQSQSLGGEREQPGVTFVQSNKKTVETEKTVKGSNEKQQLREENAQLRQDTLAVQHQLNANNVLITKPKRKAGFLENEPHNLLALVKDTDHNVEQCLTRARIRQEQQEELVELRQDLQQVENLCRSVEEELRYEREKNLEVTKHDILTQKENVKLKAELAYAQLKCSASSKECSSVTFQWELSCQKVKELEMELLQQSQAVKQQSGLREKLAQEEARAADITNSIQELQHQLNESHHRLQLSEAQLSGQKQLQEELKEARANKEKVEQQFQEEHLKRKVLEQETSGLQMHLKYSRERETQLVKTVSDLQVQCQHREVQVQLLEEEKKILFDERLCCQTRNQKLSEQLSALQQEKDTLQEKYGNILKHVDLSVRKSSERQLRHKVKLQKAKEAFICEVKQRDMCIKDLEDEMTLSKVRAEKDMLMINQMAEENKSLHREKRELLKWLQDLEETERSNKLVISTTQHRMSLLDEENKRLLERSLELTSKVSALERALRSVHHTRSLEETKTIGFSACQLQSKMFSLPEVSFSVMDLSDSVSLPKAIQDAKPELIAAVSPLPPLPFQPLEIGYLNVASLEETTDCPKEEQTALPS